MTKNYESLLYKADYRLAEQVFNEGKGLSCITGKVIQKIKKEGLSKRALNIIPSVLGHYNIVYGVPVTIENGDDVKVDRRFLPKWLKEWFDCPYEVLWINDLPKGMTEGKYICALVYQDNSCSCPEFTEYDIFVGVGHFERVS